MRGSQCFYCDVVDCNAHLCTRSVARLGRGGAQMASAEGVAMEAPKALSGVRSGRVSTPQPTRGSGGASRELSQRDPGWSPCRKRIFGIFWVTEHFW